MNTKITGTLFSACALMGCLALGTTPASASASAGYVHGVGDFRDDWIDEGLISSSRYAYSNATGWWQAILWADKNLAWDDIDCRFGPKTTSATRAWQADSDLSADGIVGEETLREAPRYLRYPHARQAADAALLPGWTFNNARSASMLSSSVSCRRRAMPCPRHGPRTASSISPKVRCPSSRRMSSGTGSVSSSHQPVSGARG
jgi:hypothetical protein